MDQQSVDKIVLQFLQTTVFSLGTISIQNLTGHFSQLPVDIRKKFNCTKGEVKKFLLAYPEVFIVNDETVSILKKRELLDLVDTSIQCEIPTMIHDDDDSNDDELAEKKQNLIDCKGKIIRLFDVFGFIEFSSPSISTTVYFDVVCFENGHYENLFKLKVGDDVNFHAKPSQGHKAPYRATKVWRNGYSVSLQGSERCYSSNTSLASQDSYQSEKINGVGKVMKITTNYGFIKPTNKVQGNVFFFRTKVQLPNKEEVKNLEDTFKEGDLLYFSAIQSRKKNAEVPWEAIKVSSTPLENVFTDLNKHYSTNKHYSNATHTSSTSSTDCSYHSPGLDTECINDENHIYDQEGVIYQLAGDKPVIHFGKNEKAIVLHNVIYKNNELIKEYSWEIDEGTKVQFNAEYDGSAWRAVLVWIGDKPILSSKKSCKKKVKKSTVSDLCEISFYDDPSDDGIWHTSSPHIDTSSWDEENSENWPALVPPVSAKSKPTDKIKLPKSENNTKVFKSEKINNISSDYEGKHNGETNSCSATLSDDCRKINNMSVSKKSRKKKNICNANTSSYATAVTALSKDSQQSNSDSNIDFEMLERYKMNNGWEKDSFNTNNEKWPALSESSATSTSSISKSSIHRSEEKLSGYINDEQNVIRKISNESNVSNFIDHNNDIQENYYSDSDGIDAQEIASDSTSNKDSEIINPRSFDKMSNSTREISYDKFPDLMGTVFNIQKYFAFIKADGLDQNLPFFWEQAFCDGCLVSKHYDDLGKAFNELDRVNFTYCSLVDENGKEWKNVLHVWKGKKPIKPTTEHIEQISSENHQTEQKVVDVSDIGTNSKETTIINVPKETYLAINSPVISLTATNIATSKNNAEDSGICMEELEMHETIVKTVKGLPNCNSSPALSTQTCQKGKETEIDTKCFTPAISAMASEDSVDVLKAIDNPSQVEKNINTAATTFLNHILGLKHSLNPESRIFHESMSRIKSADTQVSTRNQETQTEIVTCDQGTQTFITGTVLSIEVFPQ